MVVAAAAGVVVAVAVGVADVEAAAECSSDPAISARSLGRLAEVEEDSEPLQPAVEYPVLLCELQALRCPLIPVVVVVYAIPTTAPGKYISFTEGGSWMEQNTVSGMFLTKMLYISRL